MTNDTSGESPTHAVHDRDRTLSLAMNAFARGHSQRRAIRRLGVAACTALAAVVVVVELAPWRQDASGPTQAGAQSPSAASRTAPTPARGKERERPEGATVLVELSRPAFASIVRTTPSVPPSYVEIFTGDADLALTLELAGACEGVGRQGDRVFIVECSAK